MVEGLLCFKLNSVKYVKYMCDTHSDRSQNPGENVVFNSDVFEKTHILQVCARFPQQGTSLYLSS